MKQTIYLAGGCFWGVQEYYDRLKGVLSTKAGYANGKKENPTYQEVRSQATGHAETVEVVFNDEVISLKTLLEHFLRFVDPYAVNRQAHDIGTQYRSGVYYVSEDQAKITKAYFDSVLNPGYAIEIKPIACFYDAEEYHQDYLKKNPEGYCHVNLGLIKKSEAK